jgi:hypothetical protein
MDVILLCTSISSLSEVVGSMPLNCLKRPTLFVDVLSVKEHPKNLLLRVSSFQLHLSTMEPWFFLAFTTSLIWFGGQFRHGFNPLLITVAGDRTMVLPTKFSVNHH